MTQASLIVLVLLAGVGYAVYSWAIRAIDPPTREEGLKARDRAAQGLCFTCGAKLANSEPGRGRPYYNCRPCRGPIADWGD